MGIDIVILTAMSVPLAPNLHVACVDIADRLKRAPQFKLFQSFGYFVLMSETMVVTRHRMQ